MSEDKIGKLPSVRLSPLAKEDLRETWLYISENSKESADKTIDEILQKCQFLAKSPKIAPERNSLIVGLRQFPFKNYNIYYFITDFGVEIYRVLHSSRDSVQVFNETID